jgi:hypothetical protein
MPFLLSLLAAKGLGALVGSLLLAARPVPGFSTPALVCVRDTVRLETILTRGFNKQLDQILESGSLVAVGYTATLTCREPGTTSEAKSEFFHSAIYDPKDRSYGVYRSEFAGTQDSLLGGLTMRQAKDLLARVSLPLVAANLLPENCELSCRIEAALNTIELEALENRELDLNVFWNYRYPRAVSAWLRLP